MVTDDCGVKVKKTGLLQGYWRCTFSDDFSGTALDRTKCDQLRDLVGDHPRLLPRRPVERERRGRRAEPHPGQARCAAGLRGCSPPTVYMSGGVSSYHLFSQQYGRFEARIKTTAADVPGLHEAFWLWPDDRDSTINWPDSGEIDVAESSRRTRPRWASTCTPRPTGSGCCTARTPPTARRTAGSGTPPPSSGGSRGIETFVNGKSCLVNTSADPAFQKRDIINLTQAIGGADWNQLSDATPVPAATQVDYVKVRK